MRREDALPPVADGLSGTGACLLTTAYWAPVQYYSKIAAAPEVRLEQHEHYVKQTYRNRCLITTANGPLTLVVPIVKSGGGGGKRPVRDVRIDYSAAWQQKHWRAMEAAYRSSPFFDYYADDIRPFYETKEVFLFDFNEKILRLTLDLIGLKATVGYTDRFVAPRLEGDFRYLISPKLPCTEHDPAFRPLPYYQVFAAVHGFAANASILDLLCNEGPNALSILSAGR
jgi:hypothetical protein